MGMYNANTVVRRNRIHSTHTHTGDLLAGGPRGSEELEVGKGELARLKELKEFLAHCTSDASNGDVGQHHAAALKLLGLGAEATHGGLVDAIGATKNEGHLEK